MSEKPSLGQTACDGCDGLAHIKRKATGKKLLYLHCPNCGLDQRSGKLLQQKWQTAITNEEPQAAAPPVTKPVDEWTPDYEQRKATPNPSQREQQNEPAAERNNSEEEPTSKRSGNGVKYVIAGVAAIFGFGIIGRLGSGGGN